MKNIHRFLFNILRLVSLAAFTLSVLTIVFLLFGLKPFSLVSGSMEPLYHKGSMVLVNTHITPKETHIGDVLVYRSKSNSLIMHRLVGKSTFKGDANNTSEHVILSSTNLVGRATGITIPWAGTLANAINQNPSAVLTTIVTMFIAACIPSNMSKRRKTFMKSSSKRTCPICNRKYAAYPAISRSDNSKLICPICGTMEALEKSPISESVKRDIVKHSIDYYTANNLISLTLNDVLTYYDLTKKHLSIDLISTQKRKELYKDVPYVEIADLSAICRIRLYEGENNLTSLPVSNDVLKSMGVAPELIIKDALHYAPTNFPVEYTNITELFFSTLEIPAMEPEIPMYAASIKGHIRGAGVLVYPDFLKNTAEMLNGDFFVIPSSIHEIIILKDDNQISSDSLLEIVKDVNSSIVSTQEKLTDNVYHYDHINQQFTAKI